MIRVVLRNNFSHPLDRGIVLLKFRGQFVVQGRQAGEAADFGRETLEFGARQHLRQVGGARDGVPKLFGIARFRKVLMRRPHQPQDGFTVGVAGKHEADGLRPALHDLREQVHAVHAGHHHVRDDDIHRGGGHYRQRLVPAFHELHGPFRPHVTQLPLEALQHARLVIHK